MTRQLTLFDRVLIEEQRRPRARRTDPDTSHAAAASMLDAAREHHALILRALDECQHPLSAEQIAARLELTHVQVNRRMSELRGAGLIEPTDQRVPTATGRTARTYRRTRVVP